jgi:hypothetical protein
MRKFVNMKRLIFALLLCCSASLAFGQAAQTPKFGEYPVGLEKARITKIDFKKNPNARTFRTRLTEALHGGVNFAGRYIVTGWGCGTGCTNAAVLDTRTGKIHWPEEFYNLDATYGDGYSEKQIDFRKNSRLLIIHGRPGSADENSTAKPTGDYYYEWKNDRLKQLKFVPKTD